MTAAILQFPQLRASKRPPDDAQHFAPASPTHGARALSPAQEIYMDGYLERAITDSAYQLAHAITEEGQRFWYRALQRLCGLRTARRIAQMERERGLR